MFGNLIATKFLETTGNANLEIRFWIKDFNCQINLEEGLNVFKAKLVLQRFLLQGLFKPIEACYNGLLLVNNKGFQM